MALSRKQRIFINEYFKCWNAAEAARRAGYSERTARSIGSENLTKPDILEEINRRLEENTMAANEVLSRLSDMARGNLADFAGIETKEDLENHPKGHVVRKLKTKRRASKDDIEIIESEIELNDPQSALEKLGKHHGLFTDKIDIKLEKELESALDLLKDKLPPETYEHVLGIFANAGRTAATTEKEN